MLAPALCACGESSEVSWICPDFGDPVAECGYENRDFNSIVRRDGQTVGYGEQVGALSAELQPLSDQPPDELQFRECPCGTTCASGPLWTVGVPSDPRVRPELGECVRIEVPIAGNYGDVFFYEEDELVWATGGGSSHPPEVEADWNFSHAAACGGYSLAVEAFGDKAELVSGEFACLGDRIGVMNVVSWDNGDEDAPANLRWVMKAVQR